MAKPQQKINRNRRSQRPHQGAGTATRTAAGTTTALWGRHAVIAALANSQRRVHRLLATDNAAPHLAEAIAKLDPPRRTVLPMLEKVDRKVIEAVLPADAVHQGTAALVDPLPACMIEDVMAAAAATSAAAVSILVVLDQVVDPHNVGAVLRSAAAFGAGAVVVQDRHAPQVSGVLAKAASGALEVVPLVRVTNLARALESIKAAGYWTIGLDGAAEVQLAAVERPSRLALVLGGEGRGLRRLTREACDQLVRLPTRPPVASLNVSNAAAVALYEISRQTDTQ